MPPRAKPKAWCFLRALLVILLLTTASFPFLSVQTLTDESSGEVSVVASIHKPPKLSLLPIDASSVPVKSGQSSDICLTSECITETASRLARVYPFKRNHADWIRHVADEDSLLPEASPSGADKNNHTHTGIIYVKNFKAASSTAAGIALRIANRHATRSGRPAFCKWSHVRAFKYAGRDPQRSLLFTSVRDPAARALSRIFYTAVTQKGEAPTDANIVQKLHWNHRQYGAVSHQGGGYQVRYCSMVKELPESWDPQHPNQVVNPPQVQENVRDLLLAYDFVMVAERMEESVVAFALLLGLPLADVLVMNAKQNAGGQEYLYFSWRDVRQKRQREACKLSVPAKRTPVIQAHLESTEWRAKNYGDYLLHQAASQSLDRTIAEGIGHDKFQVALEEYRRLKRRANERCTNETISHCSSTGVIQRDLSAQNCYADDSGCGYPCIDRMLLEDDFGKHS